MDAAIALATSVLGAVVLCFRLPVNYCGMRHTTEFAMQSVQASCQACPLWQIHELTNCLGTATFGHPVCPGSAIDDDGGNDDLYLSSSRLRFFADVFFFLEMEAPG